tara:strand:+ start:81 stop:497 length:417 start_codon:yes stop_codon:yes gene_type:complete
MSDASYIAYHQRLIDQLSKHIKSTAPFNGDALDEVNAAFLQKLEQLTDSNTAPHDQRHLGQSLLSQIVGNYPHLMPNVPRALFWYFGGDCMHYLGDEEITHFQQLEERYHELLGSANGTADYEQLALNTKPEGSTQLH